MLSESEAPHRPHGRTRGRHSVTTSLRHTRTERGAQGGARLAFHLLWVLGASACLVVSAWIQPLTEGARLTQSTTAAVLTSSGFDPPGSAGADIGSPLAEVGQMSSCTVPNPAAIGNACGSHPPPGAIAVQDGRTSSTEGVVVDDQVPPPGTSDHYYEGSVWNSEDDDPAEFSAISVYITTPQSNPASSVDFYYVILSIWDSTSSYDQIGFDAYEGAWDVAWSVELDCGTYYYSADAFQLTPNTVYKFSETLVSGYVDFAVDKGSSEVYSNSYYTGGMWFEGGGTWGCPDGDYYEDYTDYEEIYQTTEQNWPDFDFDFADNAQVLQSCAINGCPGSWSSWSSGTIPSGAPIQNVISGISTHVENEWFNASVQSPPGLYSILVDFYYNEGGSFWTPGAVGNVCSSSCPTDLVGMSVFSEPFGWSNRFNSSTGSVPLAWDLALTVPSSATNGTYDVIVEAEDTSTGVLTLVEFSVTINHIPQGHGGCVAWGTPILTPSGYVSVQRLRVGEAVTGYSLTSNTFVTLTLTGLNATLSEPLVIINFGLLTLTADDQPIYIWNSTFEGWLHNPVQLTVGDYMFDAATQGWIQVRALWDSTQPTIVFDVVTSGTNDFIASGILLDLK
jgi:hypothetical protein